MQRTCLVARNLCANEFTFFIALPEETLADITLTLHALGDHFHHPILTYYLRKVKVLTKNAKNKKIYFSLPKNTHANNTNAERLIINKKKTIATTISTSLRI